MDMLDQALENSAGDKADDSTNSDDQVQLTAEDGGMFVTTGEEGEQAAAIASVTPQGAITLDPTVQYQFRTDNGAQQGQVTYRVVQVADERGEGPQLVAAANTFPAGTQELPQGILGKAPLSKQCHALHHASYIIYCMALLGGDFQDGRPHNFLLLQAVIQSPFSNGGSPNAETIAGETRFTYVPTVSGSGDAEVAALGQVSGAGGQFYVMMSPQDVLQGQRTIAPRTHTVSTRIEGGGRSNRDERRRATHNEVERRRRDKINNWIVQLSKLIPDCTPDTKAGQIGSKGGILAKACDHINELRTANARMAESLKESERLQVDVELLRSQCEELKQENLLLRAQLQQHGIVPPDITGSNS